MSIPYWFTCSCARVILLSNPRLAGGCLRAADPLTRDPVRDDNVHGVLQVNASSHRERRPHCVHLASARLGPAPRAGGAQSGSHISQVCVCVCVANDPECFVVVVTCSVHI